MRMLPTVLCLLTALPGRAGSAPEPASVVLVVADGVGLNALHYALARQALDGSPRIPGIRAFVEKARGSQVMTRTSEGRVTDSAAAATAMSCGVKTKRGVVGLGADGRRLSCIEELVRERKKALGLVTTTEIWDATPAAFSVHVESRRDKDAILRQQAALSPEFSEGKARSLEQAARKALETLSKDKDGFFLLLETEDTDSAAHSNDMEDFFKALEDLDAAVGVFLEYQVKHPRTTVLFVSDHDTGGLYFQDSDTPQASWTTGKHTFAPAFAFGLGPGAERQTGLLENTRVFGLLKTGLGL